MLKIMNDLPGNVLGISAEGKVTGEDYKTILIPAIEEKLKTHKKIRFLYYLGNNFTGFDFAAMLDDSMIGMKDLFKLEKCAMVSDHKMISIFVKFFGYMIPCEVRIFKETGLAKAKKWVSEK